MTRRGLLVVLAVINGVGAVVIAVGLVLLVVVPALDRPTTAAAPPVGPVVEAYLDAVADGDVAGALAVTRIQTGTFDGASSGLLQDAVLRGAQERITDPRVGAVELSGSGSRAETTVAYMLGGESRQAVLRWEYDDEAQAWRVVDGLLGTLRVAGLSGHGIPVEVAGVTPDPAAECYSTCAASPYYVLLPGRYEVRADLTGFEVHPRNTTPDQVVVTIEPGGSQRVRYLAVPQSAPWPTVNGTPTDPDESSAPAEATP